MMGYRDCPKCNTWGAIMCFLTALGMFGIAVAGIYSMVTQ